MISALVRKRVIWSAISLLLAGVLGLAARPGQRPTLSHDPRIALCGTDCFPVSHPWLLILAALFAIAGLIGLRTALRGAST